MSNDLAALQHITNIIRRSRPDLDGSHAGRIALDLIQSGVQNYTANEQQIREQIVSELQTYADQLKAETSNTALGLAVAGIITEAARRVGHPREVDPTPIVDDLAEDGWVYAPGEGDGITRDDLRLIVEQVLRRVGISIAKEG